MSSDSSGGRDAMTYRAVLERDESGAWLARVPSVAGCHTYGRSLEQARRRLREALALWVDDADRAELRFDVRLPVGTKDRLAKVRAVRERSARAQREASQALRDAAADLTGRLGLSRRDAAELLGISHQRIQQLLSSRGAAA
jgi:predicted RNase H-like HicB family nuclease